MAKITLKPLSKKDPIFRSRFMTFSKNKKKEKKMEDKIKKDNQNTNKNNSDNSKRKLLFLENIGDHNTPRDVMLKNLINVLEKNGFKIRGKK
tara:strand:- start:887 stop:1162 length:276 start_codon:yes stop_codon:yes gene_type:complete